MPAFRRVEDCRAGPNALGILVPPGQRTVVVLRPRALTWDLLPLRPAEEQAWPPAFCDFGRDEAAGVARQVHAAFEKGAGASPAPFEIIAAPGAGHLVCCRGGDLVWLVCPRQPGKPYEPMVFPAVEEARKAAAELGTVLWPAADAEQEYYFNTQNFARSR